MYPSTSLFINTLVTDGHCTIALVRSDFEWQLIFYVTGVIDFNGLDVCNRGLSLPGASIPLLHIPHISTKSIDFQPIFVQLTFCIIYGFCLSPYFDHDACLHHALGLHLPVVTSYVGHTLFSAIT